MSTTTSPAASSFTCLYDAELGDLRASIDYLRAWEPSPKRDALIAMREERIEELEAVMSFEDDVVVVCDEASFAEVIEITSPAEQLAEVVQAARIVAQIILQAARSERGAA